jgi:hypothetical protein
MAGGVRRVAAGYLPGKAFAAGALLCAAMAGGANASDLRMPVKAAAQEPDKSRYTLFNPTPDSLLRDLTTDRPDTTESPFTVDAGHIQIETNIFGYSRSRADSEGTVTKTYEYAITNFRVGLTNWAEFNVVVQPHSVVKTRPSDPAEATRSSGIGGVDLRMKINFWGNDTFDKPGATAFGLLPFVTLATDRDNGISPTGTEGGLIVPFAVKLTDKVGLGLNAGFHVVRDEAEDPAIRPGTHTEWLSSASLSYEWTENFSSYYEVAGRFGTQDPRGDIGILATGFTYKLGKNMQLDGGVNFGVTSAADRINPFLGITARF